MTSELIKIVSDHAERSVIRVGDIYIKCEASADQAKREVVAMRAAPVPTAKILWVRFGTPAVLAMQTLPGRGLRASDPDEWWEQAGALARRIHDHPSPDGLAAPIAAADIEAWIADEHTWALANTSIDRGMLHDVVAAAGALTTDRGESQPRQFQHGDLQPDHVLFHNGQSTGVLDWGNAKIGDGNYDLAVLTAHATHRVAAVVQGHDAADEHRIRAWWSIRLLAEVHWGRDHGIDTITAENRLDALHR